MISMIQKRLRNKKGFTLVELMVVVGIIAVLVGIGVPAYNSITSKAAETACDANIRIIKSAIEMYNATETTPLGDSIDALKPNYLEEIPECPVDSTIAYTIAGGKLADHTHD